MELIGWPTHQQPWVGSVDAHDIDVVAPIAVSKDGDHRAIRTAGGGAIEGRVSRQVNLLRAIGVHDPLHYSLHVNLHYESLHDRLFICIMQVIDELKCWMKPAVI